MNTIIALSRTLDRGGFEKRGFETLTTLYYFTTYYPILITSHDHDADKQDNYPFKDMMCTGRNALAPDGLGGVEQTRLVAKVQTGKRKLAKAEQKNTLSDESTEYKCSMDSR